MDVPGRNRERVDDRLANTATDHHAAKEDDDGYHRRGHEHENKLFSVQLNLVDFLIRH
jgi:hypothetical protein